MHATWVNLAWNQLWQVTLVVTVVALATRLFARERPHLAYWLWVLVLAKCLTPPVFSSPTGVFSWARAERQPTTTTVVLLRAVIAAPPVARRLPAPTAPRSAAGSPADRAIVRRGPPPRRAGPR